MKLHTYIVTYGSGWDAKTGKLIIKKARIKAHNRLDAVDRLKKRVKFCKMPSAKTTTGKWEYDDVKKAKGW